MGIKTKINSIVLPSFIGFLGIILFETIDIFWIGKISVKAVAAVGAASFIHWGVFSLMNLTCTGCSTLVAQFIGAKKEKEKNQVIVDAFWISMGLSLLIMAGLFLSVDYFFSYMGLDHETHLLAKEYFIVFIYGLPIIYVLNLQAHVFNAYGDTKTVTILLVICLALNVALDPIFIFGLGGFPKLGILGASLATLLCQALGVFLRHIYLVKKKYISELRTFAVTKLHFLKRLLLIGVPSATTNLVWTIVFPMMTVTITKFGMDPLAGLNIAHRIEGIPYFMGISFSIAMSSLVGQAIGAKQENLAKGIVKQGALILLLIFVPITLIFIFLPEQLISLINSDASIIKHGASYLRIVGYFEIFMGLELLMEGAFNGLGRTKPYMIVRIPLTLLRVPLAHYLALSMGISGVWWAISITTMLKGIILPILFFNSKGIKKSP